jgi:ribosomal protein L7/L12
VDDVIAAMLLNRVEAIKIIRTNRGLGLKEAKDVFDKAMEQQRMGMDASLIRETIAAWNAPNPNDIPF